MRLFQGLKREKNFFKYSVRVTVDEVTGDWAYYSFSMNSAVRGTPFAGRVSEITTELFRLLTNVRALAPFAKPDHEDTIRTLTRLGTVAYQSLLQYQ